MERRHLGSDAFLAVLVRPGNPLPNLLAGVGMVGPGSGVKMMIELINETRFYWLPMLLWVALWLLVREIAEVLE